MTKINNPNQNEANNEDCQISDLATDLSSSINHAIEYIKTVNDQTRLLSFNAQIEAARAGGATGAAFGVVAQAIRELSDRTSQVADDLKNTTGQAIDSFNHMAGEIDGRVRGTRLVDLALNNIDLIDRNLYERTCDVRWWATDASLVDACTSRAEGDMAFASKRMGIILSAYTVYYDLVLVDTKGKIIANGKPDLYNSDGADVSQSDWFRSAMKTTSGDDYGFETCHESPLTADQRVLAYSCTVREGGCATGRVIGVLGALFNWDDLAQVIVKRTPLSATEWPHSRVCIVDDQGRLLADSKDQVLTGSLNVDTKKVLTGENHSQIVDLDQREHMLAYAKAPGYEGYTTGWHSIVEQDLQGLQSDRQDLKKQAA